MAKVLFHIDLNAFFASAEEIRHPEYKGKPIAIGSLSSRGVYRQPIISQENMESIRLCLSSWRKKSVPS